MSWLINPSDEGLLGVYKAGSLGSPDFQAADEFSLDGSANLVPGAAATDIGMWIYDGALGNELMNIWHVNQAVPSHGDAGEMRYVDASEGHTTRLFAPVWSYEDQAGLHLTALHVVD